MKRFFTLLALAGLIAACDRGIIDPPPEPSTVVVTVTGGPEALIGAFLVSVGGAVEEASAGSRRLLLSPESDRTLVAVIADPAAGEVAFTMEVVGAVPVVELLQVANGDNGVYADASSFSVDVETREAGE